MAKMFSVVVEGLDKLKKKLNAKNTIEKPLDKQIKITTLKLEAEVKKATPVRTGRLTGSIFHDFSGDRATVGTNVEYAPYVEFGTQRMEARHVEGGTARVEGVGPFTFAIQKLDLQDVEVALKDKIEKIWGK
tara:strand:- start:10242 stop:10637 length:396 start_codon:yes stop_codon:yes gene_type:complete